MAPYNASRHWAFPKSREDREHTYIIDGVLGTTDANGNIVATNTRNNVAVTALNYFQNYKGDTGGAVEEAIEDGSWVRLREVGISYRLRNEKIHQIHPLHRHLLE